MGGREWAAEVGAAVIAGKLPRYDASMASEKTQAIVLRTVEFSETSYVVTLFTEDFGKIGALAKGARRPKGPFEGALDLLALVRIVFLRKSSGGLDLLTEAKLERCFRSARRDLTRLYAGYYVAELLTELTDEGDPHPELFAAASDTLQALDQGEPLVENILHFEVAALQHLGHFPLLTHCVGCGQTVPLAGRVRFGLVAEESCVRRAGWDNGGWRASARKWCTRSHGLPRRARTGAR